MKTHCLNGIILAGGKNSRIALRKALIKLGSHSIIENTVNSIRNLVDEIIIVTNNMDDYPTLDAQFINDIIPDKGPLGGIFSGLTLSSSDYNFVVACDMPFLDPSLIQHLKDYTTGDHYDVIVPAYNGFIEPLCAIYSKRSLTAIRKNMDQNKLKVRDFFTLVKVKEVSCDIFSSVERSFFNINTRDDLQLALKLKCG